MTFEQYYQNNQIDEGLKDKLLPLGLAASLFGAAPEALAAKKAASKAVAKPAVTKTVVSQDIEDLKNLAANAKPAFDFNSNIDDLLKQFENNKNYAPGGFNKKENKWFEYKDKGKPAIGYGHNMSQQEIANKVYANGIDDTQATELLKNDIARKEGVIKQFIKNYNSLPKKVKNAIIVAVYRGDLLPNHTTTKLINQGNFVDAAGEFLNNKDFRESGPTGGVGKRMLSIAKAFYDYGNTQKVTEEIDTPNNGFLSRPIGGPNLVNFSPNFKNAPGGIYLGSDQIHTPTVQLTKIKAIKASRKFNGKKKR